MMLKWLGRFLFVVISIVLSLQVYYYAQYSKLQKYYNENMINNINNDEIYLKGINTLADLDYYQKDPIYEFTSNNPDYMFKIALRSIAAVIYDKDQNPVRIDGLMLFLNNVEIKDTELPILKITVTLDQKSIILDNNESLSNEAVMLYNPNENFPQSNIPVLFLLNTEGSLVLNNVVSTIETIKVEYTSGYNAKDEKITFNDIALFIASSNDIYEASYVKDNDFNVNNDDFLLLKLFTNNIPNDQDLLTYNLITAKDDLTKYNKIVWVTMGGYILIVLVVAYFIFFHRIVYEKIKVRKNNTNESTITIIDNKEDEI